MREAAGDCFVQVGLIYGQRCTYEDYLRAAHAGIMTGGDAFYCAGSLDTIAKLAAEGVPVVGHVGLIPARATWTGGFKAVGRTAAQALSVYEHVKALEAAGAVGAEIEVVPARVATEISKRTSLILLSMGAGSGCDAQYLFAEDVLGYTRGHKPRHAKVYRDFRTELDRLQDERIAAFKEFRADVESGAYPEDKHLVADRRRRVRGVHEGVGDIAKPRRRRRGAVGAQDAARIVARNRRRPAKPRPAKPASIITQVEASGTGDGAKATPLKLLSAGAAASSSEDFVARILVSSGTSVMPFW